MGYRTIKEYANAAEFAFTSPRWVFDAQKTYPKLVRAAVKNSPGLSRELRALREAIPLPPNSLPGVTQRFYRIPKHNRSFCYAINPPDAQDVFDSDALVFKGSEPLLPDFSVFANWMRSAPYARYGAKQKAPESAPPRVGDLFPLIENKAPGVVTLKEALYEATLAAEVQQKFLLHYGELAPMPVPLFIHRFSKEQHATCLRKLKKCLPPVPSKKTLELLSNGIGLYIYHLPTSSFRLGDLAHPSSKKMFDLHSDGSLGFKQATSSWIRLFVRLLYLGYMPSTPWNLFIGNCLDPGNVTIQGALCDIDSIVPFSEIPDLAFFVTSLSQSLDRLIDLVGWGLSATLPRQDVRLFSMQLVLTSIRHHFKLEARKGLVLDQRVAKILQVKTFSSAERIIVEIPEYSDLYSPPG